MTRRGAYAPAGAEAFADTPVYYRDGCRFTEDSAQVPAPGTCHYGTPGGRRVALVGDSKIGQWLPALQLIAQAERWELLFYSRSGCPYAIEGVSTDCRAFVSTVHERLAATEKPDLVMVSQIGHSTTIAASEAALLAELAAAGARVVALADTPQPGRVSLPECLLAATDYWRDCRFRKNDGSGTRTLRDVVAAVPGAVFVTLNDLLCAPADGCPPVLDGIALYRTGSHLTASAVLAFTPALHKRLIEAGVARGPVVARN
ncbi:MAG: hypothetical protein LKG20_04855 [Tetrasphaera jenkinsii]|uniref:SGNH domain-containing protein n=1 Tax=Nostocoides jenkinsii Ben 74 TaxID=1193518 RepID=A0A077M9I3_9MICO|nr:SGNH hydrolase domain-containing protein [Tetrasphaera jenkinsii]MCI1261596.1 hypothetical protein [Tetrasphaera jenkinsii]CCI53996.1 hypothetical protein BN13_540004 [Tetrasphaera jenkinsii Ben 74]